MIKMPRSMEAKFFRRRYQILRVFVFWVGRGMNRDYTRPDVHKVLPTGATDSSAVSAFAFVNYYGITTIKRIYLRFSLLWSCVCVCGRPHVVALYTESVAMHFFPDIFFVS